MANTHPWAEVGAALAALEGGASSVQQLEAALTSALGSAEPPPPELMGSLRHAIAAGVLPADLPARLGFPGRARVPQETRLRGAEPAAAPTPPPKGAETRLRAPTGVPPIAPPAPAPVDVRGTASQWSEPDPQAPRPNIELSTGMLLGGRYLLERKLGEGGMGVVYFASDQEVKGETFAIKVLKSEIREQPEALALLREEVRKTRSLSHPNVVGVYSLNSDHANIYMLMEYLEGKTLDALIDEDFGRGMPFNRAWPLIQDIGAALAFAHDRSVIHSDLKPSNIFVTTSGRAKLVDFGIARAARGRPRGVDPAALGALTPAYASCEMLEGQEPDSRDDIYALACVIYELLSGKHPFGNRSAVEARDEKRTPAPLAALSRAQNAALAKALAFDREQRTPSVEALIAGLEQASGNRMRMVGLVAGIAGVLGVAAGLAWWTLSGSHRAAAPAEESSGPAALRAHDALTRVRNLAEQARKLNVDKADPSLSDGSNRLQAAEQQLAAGQVADASRSLTEAQTALRAALGSAGRLARIGSEPEEVVLAVNLCSRTSPCSAADFTDEAPRSVVLRPFALDATGVTNAAFAEFVQAKQYTTEAERGRGVYAIAGGKLVAKPGESWRTLRDHDAAAGVDAAGYPARGIDFAAAQAYCAWRDARLPTEEEWEFSARPDQRIFPWGNDPVRPDAGAAARLLPVGEQPATGRFGERGLGGMLWEWVDGGTAAERVFRGASWLDTDPVHQRLAQRVLENPVRAHIDTGLRCAKSVPAWPDAAVSGGAP
jgi:formylglycine-generating enzyme required for sulfatase activity